ncbi:metallophosphoesterase [Echinicola jeungdonensis]|uniref:Metallophosphoesterase n=1 Tax=Echinicola jeungdonensis TaxID=709343 RepID=A0ABV5J1E6_9BACT|nr:metallophosphoesterase [Echinicola jeungdonensis]MDN3668478.1 metallophosphoesterase [Echinicola jeungdonensis]
MDLFIIGDIHGCWNTFQKLLENWTPNKEFLIQVGDLVDRGAYNPQMLQTAKTLQRKYPDKTCFLRGNHEQMMIDYLLGKDPVKNWIRNGGSGTLEQIRQLGLTPESFLPFLKHLPFHWHNEHVFVSHAGISHTEDPYAPLNPEGILWNRSPLKKLSQMQVIGHTPLPKGKAAYDPHSNSWNIDTGAYRGVCLTGIKLDEKGHFLKEINIPTAEQDLPQ